MKSKENIIEIEDLQNRLREAEELLEAIKSGDVDAFAIREGAEGKPKIYTLQSSDYTYRVLIERMNEGAVSLTEDGIIVYCNKYFSNLISGGSNKLLGTLIFDLISEECREQFSKLFRASIKEHRKGESVLAVNGQKFPVYLSLTSLQPQVAAVGMVVTDLTEKKRVEKRIDDYQVLLEQKIGQLNNRNKELEQFANIISHDLKEPLRKISTYSGELIRKWHPGGNKSALHSIEIIKDASLRMKVLIDDLLAFTTATDRSETLVAVDLNAVVQKVVNDLEVPIKEKRGIIDIGKLPTVRGSASQLGQLFQNLVLNALKFGKASSIPKITIHAEIVNTAQGNIPGKKIHKISVTDNGIGFDPKYTDRIFTIFQRLHKQEYSGTGVGLAICKCIAENHLGCITAKSKPGEGSEFILYLPI